MAKKEKKVDWKEIDKMLETQEEAIDTGKGLLYSDIMDVLEARQIDSKPHTKVARGFVDGYNCGIREAMRVAYQCRFLDFDWDSDRDNWENRSSEAAQQAWNDLYRGKY